jgi:hypothetical protein
MHDALEQAERARIAGTWERQMSRYPARALYFEAVGAHPDENR